MYLLKKSIYYTPSLIMNMLVFNFQNMADIHKGYAYQIFIFLTKKELTRVQPSLPKQITKFKIE
jgi:hypothetical protein